jgi:hypothetical protein
VLTDFKEVTNKNFCEYSFSGSKFVTCRDEQKKEAKLTCAILQLVVANVNNKANTSVASVVWFYEHGCNGRSDCVDTVCVS